MGETLHCRQLDAIVVTIRTGGELRHRSEPGVCWLLVGEWRKTALAYRLISVHLHQIRHAYGARSDVLCAHTDTVSKLVFDPETPLQEMRWTEFAVRHCGNSNRLQTRCKLLAEIRKKAPLRKILNGRPDLRSRRLRPHYLTLLVQWSTRLRSQADLP